MKTIEEEIRDAMNGSVEESVSEETEEKASEETVETPVEEKDVQDDAQAEETSSKSSETETQSQESALSPVVDAPVSLSGAIKAKWSTLPADVQQEWKKREDDIHRMMTAHDGELRMGRSIKEIANPYMATIQAEGGTVEGTFKDLLNTAYVLRAGSPHQKAAAVMQVVQQFGIDMNLAQQVQQNPQLVQLQNEIHQLKQQQSPQIIEERLQERMEHAKIGSEIREFAANPKNVHFQTVRADMGALMTSGRAKDLQEAYEMACWANPSIRATNLAAQQEADKAKRKAEMDAKRKASASVSGSPAGSTPSASASTKSIEDELRAAMREASGGAV